MKNLMAALAGWLFGLGLVLGGMTQPAVVLGFLDIFGAWNPRLVFVMGGAVLTTMLGYRIVLRRAKPWLDTRFYVPETRAIDTRLVLGAALFGIGWGLAGSCPGPALASLSGGAGSAGFFVMAMVAGWWLAGRLPLARKSP